MNLKFLPVDRARVPEKLKFVEDGLSDRETEGPFLSCVGTQLGTPWSLAKVRLVVGGLRTGFTPSLRTESLSSLPERRFSLVSMAVTGAVLMRDL